MVDLQMRPRFAVDVSCDVKTLVSFIGQGLALSQMYEVRRALDVSIELAEEKAHRAVGQRLGGYQI